MDRKRRAAHTEPMTIMTHDKKRGTKKSKGVHATRIHVQASTKDCNDYTVNVYVQMHEPT